MVHSNNLKRSVQWKWVPPFPGKPQSSLLMTNVRSDFCLPAKLTSTPLLFPAPQVLFIEREPARERLVCEFPGFHSSVQWARGTRCRRGGGLVRRGAPIGYLSGCWKTDSDRKVILQFKCYLSEWITCLLYSVDVYAADLYEWICVKSI